VDNAHALQQQWQIKPINPSVQQQQQQQ